MGDLSMKTLSGTSLTSEMCWDRQMMEDTLPLGCVTLQRQRNVNYKLRLLHYTKMTSAF